MEPGKFPLVLYLSVLGLAFLKSFIESSFLVLYNCFLSPRLHQTNPNSWTLPPLARQITFKFNLFVQHTEGAGQIKNMTCWLMPRLDK